MSLTLTAVAFMNWPLAALIFAVICIFAFYRPICAMLSKAKKIGPQGLELSTASVQETSLERVPSEADEMLKFFDSKLLPEHETQIKTELSKRKITDSAEREKILIRFLAGVIIFAQFERAYHLIFGSQLQVLQTLNERGSLKKQDIKTFYDAAKTEYPVFYVNYSFDQWFNFMLTHVLILVKEEAAMITIRGKEFLKFIVQEGLTMSKIG